MLKGMMKLVPQRLRKRHSEPPAKQQTKLTSEVPNKLIQQRLKLSRLRPQRLPVLQSTTPQMTMLPGTSQLMQHPHQCIVLLQTPLNLKSSLVQLEEPGHPSEHLKKQLLPGKKHQLKSLLCRIQLLQKQPTPLQHPHLQEHMLLKTPQQQPHQWLRAQPQHQQQRLLQWHQPQCLRLQRLLWRLQLHSQTLQQMLARHWCLPQR